MIGQGDARAQTSAETTSEFLSSNGELPVSRPLSAAPKPAENGAGNSDGSDDPTLRRKKVTLTPPPVRRAEVEHDDDVRVYLAPAVAGLGTFDLGSVPASVTPPKTWKKAAWFAALSSGGVVVALMIAGSVLVGPPSIDPTSQGWPGYRGGQPLLNGEQQAGTPSPEKGGVTGKPAGGARSAGPTSAPSRASNDATFNPPRTTAAAIAAPGSTGVSTTTEPAPSTSSTVTQKPRVTPAPRETTPAPWYSFPPDAKAMGDNTEKFFNTVAQDPNAASAVTTGKLHDQGPQALAQRYAHVAYFQVKDISIDQGRGVTVNTVEVVRDDGTKTIEQRTLTFANNNKIQSDGQ
jgi:hypothetical protein